MSPLVDLFSSYVPKVIELYRYIQLLQVKMKGHIVNLAYPVE